MKKIRIGEGCFGPKVSIDDESLFVDDMSEPRETFERAEELKKLLIKELEVLIPKMDMMDFRAIAEIIANRGEWECEEDSTDTCDQCGNYNWSQIYKKVD